MSIKKLKSQLNIELFQCSGQILKMLLFYILSSSFCFGQAPGKITTLTLENWDALIDKRDPDSVWMIMFTSQSCPACKVIYPIFQKAAQESDGMVNFGTVRADQEEGLRLRFNIMVLPTFLIIHKTGRTEYSGKRNERSFVNAAAKFIPDKTLQIDDSWIKDTASSIILFTDKQKTPPIWAAISCVFQGHARVGITFDSDFDDHYKIDKKPSIVFVNSTHKITYQGKNSFMVLRQSIQDFLDGVYEEPFQFNADFFLPEEYEDECKDFTGYCIMHVVPDLDPKVKAAQEKFKNNRLKFFYGDEDLPFSFMKPGDLFIFAPHRQSAIKLESPSELTVALAGVFDGSTNWQKIETFGEK
ncbi:Thioredoxin family protein [Tritrichomonas foetus]|uniref:Thioredoxin family protein n=1 Tax=Tritrichomonas foetus TaxID=1144522 RepID=A0A1J4KKN7_9EUKA|nr:Thioredoxin family protein [Tritrichomonas foetus]|eukprot:OHT11706.1 Thioredoxin family protein [Tritrichomonas foetus]